MSATLPASGLPRASADGVLRPYPRPASARLVSYSELRSLDCWLKHHLQYVERLKPVERFVALQLGSAWDSFLNEWHAPEWSHGADRGARFDAALSAAVAEIGAEAARVDGELVDRDIPRPLDWREQLVELDSTILSMALMYVDRYGDDSDWECLGTQIKFEVPFPSLSGSGRSSTRYWLHGVVDRVSRHKPTGAVYVIDAKLRMLGITNDYREGFENDLQLALYGWALAQLGLRCAGGLIDASSAMTPKWPPLKAQPETIYTGEVDADGKPVALTEPMECPDCAGEPPCEACTAGLSGDTERCACCPKCGGEGVARYASGARKGEIKTRTVKRPALYSDGHVNTTLPIYLAAIEAHDLDPAQYAEQIAGLEQEWNGGELVSPFHWRTDLDLGAYTTAQLDQAIKTMQYIGPQLEKLPPAPMPSPFKCKFCAFKALCPSTDLADYREGFTTPDQRARLRLVRAESAAAAAVTDEAFPTF